MVIVCQGGRFLDRAALVATLMVVGLVFGRTVRSDEPAAGDTQRPARAADERLDDANRPPPDPQARTYALSVGFVLLGCIIVGGALLLTLVVTWGNRARRAARSPLPPVSERDELWFLKPKKPLPEGESDDETEAPSDSPGRE
jgi:hypothetical protein